MCFSILVCWHVLVGRSCCNKYYCNKRCQHDRLHGSVVWIKLWQQAVLQAKGFDLSYLEKVAEVKDTMHKQSLLHHVCNYITENYPETSDLYSEIPAVTNFAKVSPTIKPNQAYLAILHLHWLISWSYWFCTISHDSGWFWPAFRQLGPTGEEV